MTFSPQRQGNAIRPADLYRKVKNLNVKHNVDWCDPGFIWIETWRRKRFNTYRLMIRGVMGPIHGSSWLALSDMVDHLCHKDWRNVLRVARGDLRWPE